MVYYGKDWFGGFWEALVVVLLVNVCVRNCGRHCYP